MIEFAHLVYQAFLPSIALGIALSLAWRCVEVGRLRTTLQWLGSLLFFVPQPFALFLGSYSAGLRLYQQALLALWGFGVAALLFAQLARGPASAGDRGRGLLARAAGWGQTADERRRSAEIQAALAQRRRPQRKPVIALGAFAMTVLGAYCGWNTVGDYVLKHARIAGRVDGARVVRNTRSPSTYQVIVDGRPYGVTRDLLARMRPGDYVEADVGVASRTIVAIRRDVHAPAAGPSR